MILTKFRVQVALCALLAWTGAPAQQTALPVAELTAGMHVIRAEIANTYLTRMQGLMYRDSLAQNAGMIFDFERSEIHCMWMKNTLIPLSVAFIDERGEIVNIADMRPHSEQSHCAARPVRFALEMNRGWFAQRGIRAGNKIRGLEKLAR